LLLNKKLGPEVSLEDIVHLKLLIETLRKTCFWRWHQHLNFGSWTFCSWIAELVETLEVTF